jgi:hypothetical protein
VQGPDNAFGVNCTAHEVHGLPQFGVGVGMLIEGLFAAAAVMISFGALIGKATFDQMIVVAVVETAYVPPPDAPAVCRVQSWRDDTGGPGALRADHRTRAHRVPTHLSPTRGCCTPQVLRAECVRVF